MQHVELPITGMTCASCASRVERSLNEVDGVTATVNYATERATVDFDPAAVAPEQLVGAVEADRVRRAAARRRRAGRDRGRRRDSAASLRRRSTSRAALSLPVLLLSMVPPLQFDGLGVGRVRARHAGRAVGRLAVPRGGLGER